MSTQASVRSLLATMDKRYASAESVAEISHQLERATCAFRQAAELNRKTQFIISGNLSDPAEMQRIRVERIKNMEFSLGKIIWANSRKKLTGSYPTEAKYRAEVNYVQKAISEGTSAAGGTLIPQEWTDFILPELGAKAVILKAGPVVLPMQTNVLNVPGLTTPDASCQWLGENSSSTESSPPTRNVQLKLNTARLLAKVSLEFLRDATPETDAALQSNLVRVMARFVDNGYLNGTGAANTPTGLSVASGITSLSTIADTGNGGLIAYNDFSEAIYGLDKNNAPEEGRAWFWNPRTQNEIREIKDNYGRPIFVPDAHLAMAPNVLGYPAYQTTQIPINQTKGTGNTCSYLLLAAMSDVLVGIGHNSQGIEIALSDQAFFSDAAYGIRVLFRTDIQPGHPESIVNMSGLL